MDLLPAEILKEIVSYLFGADLISLRLVNHNLSGAATIFKFRSLNVRMTRRGLENLLNVSRQPELARCVREITYPHGYLVPTRMQDEDTLDPIVPSANESFPTRFFEWYNDNYVAQIELQNSGEFVPTLETALSKMGNVRVIIPGYYNYDAHDELCGRWFRTLTETEMDFVARHAWSHLLWTTMRFKKSSGRRPRKPLWTCTTFDLEGIEAFKKDAKEGRIFTFISFAPNLRILSLKMKHSVFLDELEDGSPEIPLLDILSRSYVWKHLHTFKLFMLPINPIKAEDSVEFLGRHASTLKCLHFDYVELYGTWREVLDFSKERIHLTGLKLYHVVEVCGDHEFLKFYGTNESRRMEDYVLRGSAPFPPTRMELDD
ncbi:hypothetical protein RUND412_008341 [Rhizina undulata]